MGYILAKTVNGKSVNLLQDYFYRREIYLRKSDKDPQKSIFIELGTFF